jgi:hypothetical protein
MAVMAMVMVMVMEVAMFPHHPMEKRETAYLVNHLRASHRRQEQKSVSLFSSTV